MFARFSIIATYALANVALVLSVKTCVECGKDGSGCLAANQTKGTAYTLSAQKYPGETEGYLFTARAPDGNVLLSAQVFGDVHKFDFATSGPTMTNLTTWPISTTQHTLWLIKTKTLKRYYYLTGYDECIGKWNTDAFGNDTVITVYQY